MTHEIGGYIELDRYTGQMLHDGAVALNCGRNCLAYLLQAKKIKKILLPKFLCDSVVNVCRREQVTVRYYSIGNNFKPENITLQDNEWLYIVNYYGQLDNSQLENYVAEYKRVIIDQAQAYFQPPIDGVDTLYTCRKFFGVADGAFLYTDTIFLEKLQQDESFSRMNFLLGRFERTASEFYAEYSANNHLFANEQIKKMSKLTDNLLRGIDYEMVKRRRTDNFLFLHQKLGAINKLKLNVPVGAFMYPLYVENGASIRKKLQKNKIYIPTLWPFVFEICNRNDLEYDMAANILPIPVDQRYGIEDMEYICSMLKKLEVL